MGDGGIVNYWDRSVFNEEKRRLSLKKGCFYKGVFVEV